MTVIAEPLALARRSESTPSAVDPAVLAFYTEHCDEAERLTGSLRGRLEAVRVRELLAPHLPAVPGPIADIGGGPGVHALWLQNRGYAVDLLDLIPRHIRDAQSAGICSARLGDARALPWPDARYGAALLAGPLYHLSPADRAVALREAARVVRPGGIVAAVAVNRYANLFGAAVANQLQQRRPVVDAITSYGYSAANDRVPHMYYHSEAELTGEFTAAGLRHVETYGLTGPGGWLTVMLDRHYPAGSTLAVPATLLSPDPLNTALAAARDADNHPDLTSASAQLFAVGRVG